MGSSQHTRGHVDPVTPNSVPLPLSSALSTPWDFLCPSKELHSGILDTAKNFVDSLAVSVSNSQTTRQRNIRKRKRSDEDQDVASILRLKQLYVDGFTTDQVWEQALRIFDATDRELQRDYTAWTYDARQEYSPGAPNLRATVQDGVSSEDGNAISDSEDFSDGHDFDTDEQNEPECETKAGDVSSSDMSNSDFEKDGSEQNIGDDDDDDKRGTYVEDRFGLNDGFFSIDDFNQQTELLERQDVRGELDDESDEDEINWDVDPLSVGGFSSSQKEADKVDDELDGSDEEDDGPTFDNLGADDDSDIDEDDSHTAALGGAGFINTSDIMYADFFAPPPRKASARKSRPLPKTQPHNVISDNDVDRAMADVHRDLFDDEVSVDENDDEAGGPRAYKSTHETQRARIADEIRRLEAANVTKKEWMVSGEARATERPTNSLIEEGLDFERIGKPVPVVTTEISESIEDLIKRRIIAKEFDEVVRRRPGLSEQQSAQKTRVEVEDSKPQHSLAELYEKDHLQATDSNYVDPKNQKLLKEHSEITNLWKEISSQLDTLSNWHYKPKAPQANISVVTDVAAITMEDAQPTASGAVRTSATLAPQELYAPGETARATGEVVMRNGVPVTKEEMTREEKAKLRRRQKKANQSSADAPKQRSRTGAEKQQIVSDLKRGGVKLIDKGGEMVDINGGRVAGASDSNGGHAVKL
ncbi:rRNA-processing protein MPP10 [Aspergillus undulatus]|uniref:rRNA-processing protein MPP10 n=1 Tax=Aspergillus undulatus TaxID=1810928 RepID=UPI003CCD9BE5